MRCACAVVGREAAGVAPEAAACTRPRPAAPPQSLRDDISVLLLTLPFLFDSGDLTAGSRRGLVEVPDTVRTRAVPGVVVRSHTGTAGERMSDLGLGPEHANAVRALLIEGRPDPSNLEVASHRKSGLVVPAANDVPEPRSRRVEVTVR